jgi:beta-lactamase class A
MITIDDGNKISINRAFLLTLLAFAFALGVFTGSGMDMLTSSSADKIEAVPESGEGTFRFIRASTTSFSSGNNRTTKELKPFQYKVNELVERSLKDAGIASVAVYFRDLNNGNWFGIGEHDKFLPKGLLKVPLMIAYFKWAESNPLVLRKTLIYAGDNQIPEREPDSPARKLEPGKTYSVNDLIFRMIAYDDAAAYKLLYAHLPPGRLEKIYSDLSVEYNPQKQDDLLSLREFASFYRVLYNASYLSEEMSEKALRYLSKTTSRNSMAAGIPPNIEIAAKRGERTDFLAAEGNPQETRQLHEFGIIYHPNRPFLLGIMTRGTDIDRMTKVIRDINHLVYEEIDKQS